MSLSAAFVVDIELKGLTAMVFFNAVNMLEG